MLSIIEKFKNSKILLKDSWKIVTPFGRQSWKTGTPLETLARQVETFARFWHVGTPSWIISTSLVRWHVRQVEKLAHLWHVKMRSWYAFGTLKHGQVDSTGKHGTYGTRFSKLKFCQLYLAFEALCR